MIPKIEDSGAVFSEDGLYRYVLWQTWDRAKPELLFVGLNPTLSNDNFLNPTVRRCIDFAHRWGYGTFRLANLYAFMATQPEDLFAAPDPVGPENDAWLQKLGREHETKVYVWGNHGAHHNRDQAALKALGSGYCLRKNKNGQPAHPLYLPKSSVLVPY